MGIWPYLIPCLQNVQGGKWVEEQEPWVVLFIQYLCRRREVNRFTNNPWAPTGALGKHLSWSIGYSGSNFLRIKRRWWAQWSLIFIIAICVSDFIAQLLFPWLPGLWVVKLYGKPGYLSHYTILPWNLPPHLVYCLRPRSEEKLFQLS